MVDIVHISYTVVEVEDVADGSDDVGKNDVLRRKVVLLRLQRSLDLIFAAAILQYVLENRIEYLVSNACFADIEIDIAGDVYKVVAYDLCDVLLRLVRVSKYGQYACVLDLISLFEIDLLALLGKDLTRIRIDYVLRNYDRPSFLLYLYLPTLDIS